MENPNAISDMWAELQASNRSVTSGGWEDEGLGEGGSNREG